MKLSNSLAILLTFCHNIFLCQNRRRQFCVPPKVNTMEPGFFWKNLCAAVISIFVAIYGEGEAQNAGGPCQNVIYCAICK